MWIKFDEEFVNLDNVSIVGRAPEISDTAAFAILNSGERMILNMATVSQLERFLRVLDRKVSPLENYTSRYNDSR